MWISKLLPVIIWSQVCLKQVWANTMCSRVNNPKMKKIVSKNFPISLIVILEPFHAKRCAPNEEFCNLKMCAVSKAGIKQSMSEARNQICKLCHGGQEDVFSLFKHAILLVESWSHYNRKLLIQPKDQLWALINPPYLFCSKLVFGSIEQLCTTMWLIHTGWYHLVVSFGI